MRATLLTLAAFASFAPKPVEAQGWTFLQKAGFTVNVACNAFDAAQTSWAMDQGGYTERNPLLGPYPSDERLVATKVIGLAVIFALADEAPGKYRFAFLAAATLPCLAAVAHNHSEGIRP